ncbi:site-specific integrase [Veillonella criceti]|uniref:Integrase n=1 Tax=Veillonella criceti TaxID=103891 RepID=A0A380NK28_9FIRM|nr:site-specific integrase [Veillonella criceti]SUP42838.1 Integrase [Veillonella criceti]
MRRRSNGEGSIYHNKKRNMYELRITYTDPLGIKKRKAFYGKTIKEVKENCSKWKENNLNFDNIVYKNPLVKDWIVEWLETYVKNTVRPSTYEKYKCCLNPIKDFFGDKHLNNLDPTSLQHFFNRELKSGGKNKKGLSTLTIRNQRRYLSSCIDTAIKLELITKNPVKLTKPPKIKKKEIEPLTIEECKKIINLAYNNVQAMINQNKLGDMMSAEDLYIGVYIAIETGMRLGELMALRWNDVINDIMDNEYIIVQRSKSKIKEQDITRTKTGLGRKIQISNSLSVALKKHFKIQKAYIKEVNQLYNDQNYIIGGLFGNGYSHSHYSSRKFKKLLKQANIERRVRFHDLRHTHATLLLLAGVNPKIVQERLGHASIDMTLDTYSHLTLANQSVAVNVLDKFNI